MASKWEGGDNWVKAPQWSSGKANDTGHLRKKYGNAGMKRGGTYRFNPNTVPSSHPGCTIKIKATEERKRWVDLVASGNRPCKYYSSGIRKD